MAFAAFDGGILNTNGSSSGGGTNAMQENARYTWGGAAPG